MNRPGASTTAPRMAGSYPATVPGWGIKGDLLGGTIGYRHNMRFDYAKDNLKESISSGNALIRRADGLGADLFQYQEHGCGKSAPNLII